MNDLACGPNLTAKSVGGGCRRKRQRTGALQDADARRRIRIPSGYRFVIHDFYEFPRQHRANFLNGGLNRLKPVEIGGTRHWPDSERAWTRP